ncbi:MAG: response regulator [Cyanobacteria bacterium P01_A01_bin.45]
MDPSIREQGYAYFLSEAPELLQTIEEELFSLAEERTTARIHELMRATHTLKGGAANVGLEEINKISHSLEDVFKALYNPDVEIGKELHSLLFQAFECLQLALTTEITGNSIDHDSLMQRAATVFTQLQENLGDAFGAETHIPTSEELGFDIVLSIFETGISQRIESIAQTLEDPPENDQLAEFLRSQFEVFTGLSESLNLPGFGEIAELTLIALDINPQEAQKIGEVVLKDLQQSQTAVLEGDRARGGEASLALKELARQQQEDYDLSWQTNEDSTQHNLDIESGPSLQLGNSLSAEIIDSELIAPISSPISVSLNQEIEELYDFLINKSSISSEPLKPKVVKFYLKVIRYILGWFNHELKIPGNNLGLHLLIPKSKVQNSIEYVENWLQEFIDFVTETDDSKTLRIYRLGIVLTILIAVAKYRYFSSDKKCDLSIIKSLEKRVKELAVEYKKHPQVTKEEKDWLSHPKLQILLEIKQEFSSAEVSKSEVISEKNDLESIWGEAIEAVKNTEYIAKYTEENPEYNPEYINNSEDVDSNKSYISVDKVNKNVDAQKVTLGTENSITSEVIKSDTEYILPEQNLTPLPSTIETTIEKKGEPKTTSSPKNNSRSMSFVRVDIEGLQRLNYLAGELLIYQKQRSLQDERLISIVAHLSQQIHRHQETLEQLKEIPLQKSAHSTSKSNQEFASINFDSLEMDEYTDFHLTLHSAMEETLQLQEATESIDLLLRQSNQVRDKKQRLTLSIIDNLVEARMLPLGNILNRFPQLMAKLQNMSSKRVNLRLSGTQVLVDKAIAEKLYDPLLHIVRNAYDHGIDTAEERLEYGKSEIGTIEISAYHQGSQTIIEVKDDGKGLNFDKIREKAIELGLLSSDTDFNSSHNELTSSELLEFIFSPGFSTAGQVSEISGRGIGLDIVRSQLEALNGSVSVHSIPRQGTTFILKIPFSMTTDKLMIIQSKGVNYALLMDSIERILVPSAENIKTFEGKKALYWKTDSDEHMISLRPLSEMFGYSNSLANTAITQTQVNIYSDDSTNISNDNRIIESSVLLIRCNEQLIGLEVDQIIGEQELVIRPLGSAIAPPKFIYGCSSLANGNLILVIDGTQLVEQTQMQATLDYIALPALNNQPSNQNLLSSASETESTPLLSPSSGNINAQNNSRENLRLDSTANSEIKCNQSKVILVVDDAISLRQTLSLTLQKYGHQVVQAQNGLDALEQLKMNPQVEVVISDLEMPRMNGFELVTNLKQNPDTKNLPVVILTSRSAEKHRQLAQALGANAYLTKPYLEQEFISTVNNLINDLGSEIVEV